jgi:hypothetical protein
MKVSRIVLMLGAVAASSLPVAAQTKAGAATSVSKSTAARVKAVRTTRTPTTSKSAAAPLPEPVIELPVNGKIVLSNTLKVRLQLLLAGSTMTFDEAITGWRNHGQLVAAMNAAGTRNLPFPAIHHEVVTNQLFLVDAVAVVRGATAPPMAFQ